MSSDRKIKRDAGDVVQSGAVCTRNYKPWIMALVVMSLLTIVWALYEGSQHDEYINAFLSRKGAVAKTTPQSAQLAAGTSLVPAAQVTAVVGNVQLSYHQLIDAVRPAVVSIEAAVPSAQNVPGQAGTGPFPADIAFNRIGSGIIIDSRGYVLSSYHVIVGAEAVKATVYGSGGSMEFPLKLVKGDLRSDLALLRIQGSGPFPSAPLGNSDAVRTGDMVLTIGSPFGLEQTVTSGMISSRNRTLQMGDVVYENLFQTDSAINSGSSGGPMLNIKGEVIGINTAIFAPTGVFNGVGFATPINRAAGLVAGVIDFNNTAPGTTAGQLVAWASQGRQVGNNYRLPNGQTVVAPHGPLGACVDCHPQLFEQQGGTTGQQVARGGEGRLVGNSYLLPNGMTVKPPHTLRGLCTNCHQLSFLEQMAKTQAAVPAAWAFGGPGGGRGGGRGLMQNTPYRGAVQGMALNEPTLGVALIDVDDIICRQAQMLHPEGVYVTNVMAGGPGATAGIQPGDILLRITGRKIRDYRSLVTLLASQKTGSRFELVYLRNGSRQTARIKVVR